MNRIVKWSSLLSLGAATFAAAGRRSAQQGADFYKGKTVTYIVATAPGGGYDTYGRLVAEYMQKYLPGSTFVVRNMPGAGHVIGANAIYASRPDGLTIGTFNTGLIYNQLIGLEGVQVRPHEDVVDRQGRLGSPRDRQSRSRRRSSPSRNWSPPTPITMATAEVGSASYVETVMLTNALRLPVKVVTGYNGNEDQLAMRRAKFRVRSHRARPTSSSSRTGSRGSSRRSAAARRTVPQLGASPTPRPSGSSR